MSRIFEYPNSVGTWRYNNSPTTTNCLEHEIGDKELFSGGNWEKVSDELSIEIRPKDFQSTLLEQREQLQNDILCVLDGMDDAVLDAICSIIVERFGIILEKLNE